MIDIDQLEFKFNYSVFQKERKDNLEKQLMVKEI